MFGIEHRLTKNTTNLQFNALFLFKLYPRGVFQSISKYNLLSTVFLLQL